jgi:hypothetical protein
MQTATIQALQMEVKALSDVQETALDLYARGLNVFPVPSAWEWRAKDPKGHKKPPYIVRPLFYSRMHHSERVDFTPLFERANIALMMGRTSGNLLAIDCDSQAAFEMIGKELDARSLPYWAIVSHRGGPYLLRLAEGEAANMPAGQTPYQDVEIWGNCHYIVIPPSIHPQGTVYQWATPEPRQYIPAGENVASISVLDLNWLGVELVKKARKKWQEPELYGLPEWGVKLSRKNRQIYAHGANEGQRNIRLTALAYDLAGCEIDYHAAQTTLLEAADRCNPPYPKRDTLAILRSAYSQDREPARKGGQNATVKIWQKAEAFAQSYNWRETFGRRAITREAVYLACVERSCCDNSDVFRASIREVAEIASVSKKVSLESLHDLLPASDANPNGVGLLKYASSNTTTGANLYTFVFPYLVQYPPLQLIVY